MSEAKISNRHFAREGLSRSHIQDLLVSGRKGDLDWRDPKNLQASYFAGDDVVSVAADAYNLYMGDNQIYGPAFYPSLPRLEAEVVTMVKEMLNAPAGAGGSITTGGTESITMAVKTARDWAREHKPGAAAPEILAAESAHPAFSKAAAHLGLEVVRIPVGPDYAADPAAMAAAVNENTVMIMGSAPPYPIGVVDPIEVLGAIAAEHDLWMHVDACGGGFFLPFVEALGEPVPCFDFRVDAVNSMSVDLHKYGYANRGSSSLLLRDAALERYQRFNHDAWSGGAYSTLNFVGSRAGGPVASAWAVMRYLGFDGYAERVRAILKAKRRFIEGIRGIEEICVLGDPQGGHFSIGSTGQLDINAVAEGLLAKGWRMGRMRRPPALLLLLNHTHGAVAEEFLNDLAVTVDAVKAGHIRAAGDSAVYIS